MKPTHILKTTNQPVVVLPKGRTLVSQDGTSYQASQKFKFGTLRKRKDEMGPTLHALYLRSKLNHNPKFRGKRIGDTYYIPIVKGVGADYRQVLIPYTKPDGTQSHHFQVVKASKLQKIKEEG